MYTEMYTEMKHTIPLPFLVQFWIFFVHVAVLNL
jgi:hypothetical protein